MFYFVGGLLVAAYAYWRWHTAVWCALAYFAAHRLQIGLLIALAALLGLAGFLAGRRLWKRWLRRRAETADLIEDWPELADGLGLSGSAVVGLQRDQGGLTVRLQLNRVRGQTSTDLVAKLPRLESALRVRPGAVRVLPDAARADHCTLRVVERDPLAKPIAWPASGTSTITEPVTLGLFEDHRRVELRLWEADRQRHVLIAGVNGSGKSGLINVALGSLARCRDLVLWGVDLKGGMELAPWHPVLDRLATTPEEARLLLAAANRTLDARTRLLAGRRARRWQPMETEPLLLIVVDEISELGDEGLSLVQRIARLGRAPGVQLIVATQRPSARQLESADESGVALRGQLHTRICMRVTETREADMILGAGLVREGWRADRLLREPGTFVIFDPPQHVEPVPARCYWMSDSAVRAAVADCRELRPRLDEASLAVTHEPLERVVSALDEGSQDDLPEEPEAAILEALRRAETASRDELAALTGQARTSVYERLRRLESRGQVRRITSGQRSGAAGRPGELWTLAGI
ncbi:MAG: winged helix-turn-helix transcriptional regulator [Candidatus Dormibacteraeota bacterium]|nr:winged helix-turn-helix transcriptional regulator [Candidatus Dormibacteraeota bacterium]